MGLSFADNPARAAEYYARALAADTASDADPGGAVAALEAVCARLDQLADTLSRGAYDQYCAE
jgi:hypothetical protein